MSAVAIVCLLTESRYGFGDEPIVPCGDTCLYFIRLIYNTLHYRGRKLWPRGVKSASNPLELTSNHGKTPAPWG